MKILRLEHVGTDAYSAPIEINFEDLPEVVAVCGPVGAGKTTLLDLIPGALFLTMPYRPGPLHENFQKSGYIRETWEHQGRRYLSVISVEPQLKKTEALLYDVLGGPPLAGPLQNSYLAKITEILGDLSLFLTTTYAVQPSVMTTKKPVGFMTLPRAERRGVMATLLGLERYERRRDIVEAQISQLTSALTVETTRKTEAAKQADDLPGIQAELEVARDRERETRDAVQWAKAAASAIQQRIVMQAGAAEVLARIEADVISAQSRLDDLTIRKQLLRGRIEHDGSVVATAEDVRAAEQAVQAAEQELDELTGKIAKARAAQVSLEAVESQARTHRHALDDIAVLSTVPCGGQGEYAGCPFIVRVVETSQRKDVLVAEIDRLKTLRSDLRAQAESLPVLEAIKGRYAGLSGRKKKAAERRSELERAATALDLHATQLNDLDRDLLAQETILRGLRAEREAVRTQLTPGLLEEAESAARQLADAERLSLEATLAMAQLNERCAQAERAAVLVREAAAAATAIEVQRRDWVVLSQALAPTGIPALKIDLALPLLSVTATSFLRECFQGGQWAVEFISQRASSDQKKSLETLDVVVLRNGQRMDATKLSGGEGVLISEAIALAIAFYRGTEARWEPGTLLRDEVSSSLGSLAGAYADMLRRVVQSGGATQVVYVTHDPESQKRADARVWITDGVVEVR